MKIKEVEYKEWKLYYSEKDRVSMERIGENIVDENFEIIQTLKDTKRNYVAIIKINNIKYILKELRSEIIIPQRKIQTLVKKGEALTTLINGLEAIDEGLIELVKPLIALVKRGKMIEKSFILMEYIEGKILKNTKDIIEVIEVTKKFHNLGRYHGDLNTSNFLRTETGLRIVDTQMKKEKKLWFKRSNDILILKEDLLVLELKTEIDEYYPEIKEKRGYLLAKFFRKIKKLKLVECIREKKKQLRKKGWKI